MDFNILNNLEQTNLVIDNITNTNLIFELIALIIGILILSIAIDIIFGELPTKIHPVVSIGKLIDFFSIHLLNFRNRLSGVILTFIVSIVTILLFSTILAIASLNIYLFIVISAIILSSTFSIKMLLSSANNIKSNLLDDIVIARKSMAYLVSRNTEELSEELIVSATIETLSENITDSVIAPIFYYVLAIFITILSSAILYTDLGGNYQFSFYLVSNSTIPIKMAVIIAIIIPIIISLLYRVINTLDAMVGYKNDKYEFIGFFPAKLDDILNFIPSRFTGLIVILASWLIKMNWRNSYFIFKRDSRKCPSPNSGFTMAPTAGALDIQLVKKGVYVIGDKNKSLEIDNISKAIKLSKISIFLSIFVLVAIFIILIYLTYLFF